MFARSLTLLGVLAVAYSVPLDQANWQLVPNAEGRLHLVNINPYNLPEASAVDPEVLFNPESDIEFRLFTRSNPTAPQILQINNAGSITGSNFNPAHPTRFTIHGWNGNGNDGLNTGTRNELLALGDFNVIAVDWSVAAVNPNYVTSRNAVGPAGFGVGRLIDRLVELRGANVNTISVIGFSLGAHVAGNAGKHFNGRLNSIIALDPAGPLFSAGQSDAVSPQDGLYVETIMTNAGLLGTNEALGQANFYPNGGRTQPGCGVDIAGGCAHGRAPSFYIESIRSSVPFRSTRCANLDEVLGGSCTPSGPDANMGGEPSNFGRGVHGIYFLTTNAASPFAQGCRICSGQLIFEDNFRCLDRTVWQQWQHENSLGGGGNNEFQWYSGSGRNSYIKNNHLYIRPTLTSDEFGEAFLRSGVINLNEGPQSQRCTDAPGWAEQIHGCYRRGSPDRILNPVRSARLRTVNSFVFKYGKVEINAKLPQGDWLWPALWLLPKGDTYGYWPKSGEVDLMESRGNRNLMLNNENIGVGKVSSCLHFGDNPNLRSSQCGSVGGNRFGSMFNRYQLTWTKNVIQFGVNDKIFRTVTPYEGFWKLGGFSFNPWPRGSKMAPFDREFYIVMNVAVGGDYFPDNAWNPHPKPWRQGNPSAMTDFYKAKSNWYSTWGDAAALEVDWVRVWAA